MISYYTSIFILVWLALGVLCLLIWENNRLPEKDKRFLYITYILIALAALGEWCGVQLDGREEFPAWLLKMAKCADFILTPIAGGVLMMQLRLRGLWRKGLIGILGVNTVMQLVSAFTDWMIRIDDSHHFTHGPLYGAYIVLCAVIMALVVIAFVLYGRSFRRQNRMSLMATVALVVVGVFIQEALPGEHRTSYLALTLGAAMMFIHYAEFSSLRLDDYVAAQQLKIDTDALTGVSSRHAYNKRLKALNAQGVPGNLAAFTIDINGLKQVNDTLGHDAGDELIVGAARCVETAMGEEAGCFRTGGDEFVVLAPMSAGAAEDAVLRLKGETDDWRGRRVHTPLTLAVGYALAADNLGLSAEQLIREADMAMYAAKAEYYRHEGRDRRGARRQPGAMT